MQQVRKGLSTFGLVSLLLVWAYFIFADLEVTQVALEKRFLAPSSEHWFGTDELGRDVFRRTLAAFGYSFSLVLLALIGASIIGAGFGILAGFSEARLPARMTDQLINIVWSLPGLVFFIAVTTYFGRNFFVIAVTMATVSWVPIARVVRLEITREKRKNYVTALRAFGFANRHVVRAILTNVKIPLVVVALAVALDLVGAESGLSFLGLGIQPPKPSLGTMIYSGLYYSSSGWWMVSFPLLVLVALIMFLRALITDIDVAK